MTIAAMLSTRPVLSIAKFNLSVPYRPVIINRIFLFSFSPKRRKKSENLFILSTFCNLIATIICGSPFFCKQTKKYLRFIQIHSHRRAAYQNALLQTGFSCSQFGHIKMETVAPIYSSLIVLFFTQILMFS